MKYSLIPLAAYAAMALADTDPAINTPVSVTTCQVTSLTFSGTQPPFTISAIPGGQAGATPYEDIVTTSTSPYAWLVNLAGGTYTTLQIRDANGDLQYSAAFSVIAGSNTSCVGTNTGGTTIGGGTTAGGSTTTGGGASTTSPSGSSTTGTGTSGGTTTSKPASSTGSASTTSAATSSTSSGAASHLESKLGLAGFLGFVGAAFML